MTESYNNNSLLHSIIYEIEFPDGQNKKYTVNILAENVLSQINSEDFNTVLFNDIIDFRKDITVIEQN